MHFHLFLYVLYLLVVFVIFYVLESVGYVGNVYDVGHYGQRGPAQARLEVLREDSPLQIPRGTLLLHFIFIIII